MLLASGWAWAATVTDITEKGIGTTRQVTPDGCQDGDSCTDRVNGSIVGTPVDNPNLRRTDDDERAGIVGTVTSDFKAFLDGSLKRSEEEPTDETGD